MQVERIGVHASAQLEVADRGNPDFFKDVVAESEGEQGAKDQAETA